jgi:hypothetical protein
MEFKVLTLYDCLEVATWRNETLNALRTPYGLTNEQQADFYHNVVCDGKANARYWGIHAEVEIEFIDKWSSERIAKATRKGSLIIGMAGIENIEWENRRGEISMILDPSNRGNGFGDEAFTLLLSKGFYELNLENINKYGGQHALFPNMKFWAGKYWRGLYFNFERSKYDTNNS